MRFKQSIWIFVWCVFQEWQGKAKICSARETYPGCYNIGSCTIQYYNNVSTRQVRIRYEWWWSMIIVLVIMVVGSCFEGCLASWWRHGPIFRRGHLPSRLAPIETITLGWLLQAFIVNWLQRPASPPAPQAPLSSKYFNIWKFMCELWSRDH